MSTGRKLVMGGILIGGLIAYTAYRGASASWQYYLTADECLSQGKSLVGHRLQREWPDRPRHPRHRPHPNAGIVCPGRRGREPEGGLLRAAAGKFGRRDCGAGRGPSRQRRSPSGRTSLNAVRQQVRVAPSALSAGAARKRPEG